MKMVDRQSLIISKYPKNMLYTIIQFDLGIDIFEFLPIKESDLVENIDKVFNAIRYNMGDNTLTYINRSIKITTLYFRDEVSIEQIARSYKISCDDVMGHINFVLSEFRHPVYWNMVIHGEFGKQESQVEFDKFSNSYTSVVSDKDFDTRNKDMRKKNYPKSLYYDIFNYGINYNSSTFVVPDDSVIEANINMALKEFNKNNTHPNYDHNMAAYLIMYYKDGMNFREIGAAFKKQPYDVESALKCIIKILRTPRYSYILSHGKPNPDYTNIDNGISVLNVNSTCIRLLYARNIYTIDFLVSKSTEEILALYGIGPATVKKIEDALSAIGLSLGMDKAYKKYAYNTDDVDMLNRLRYDLSYEDACEFIRSIKEQNN